MNNKYKDFDPDNIQVFDLDELEEPTTTTNVDESIGDAHTNNDNDNDKKTITITKLKTIRSEDLTYSKTLKYISRMETKTKLPK